MISNQDCTNYLSQKQMSHLQKYYISDNISNTKNSCLNDKLNSHQYYDFISNIEFSKNNDTSLINNFSKLSV